MEDKPKWAVGPFFMGYQTRAYTEQIIHEQQIINAQKIIIATLTHFRVDIPVNCDYGPAMNCIDDCLSANHIFGGYSLHDRLDRAKDAKIIPKIKSALADLSASAASKATTERSRPAASMASTKRVRPDGTSTSSTGAPVASTNSKLFQRGTKSPNRFSYMKGTTPNSRGQF